MQNEAVKRGCQQVLWLYGQDEEITEVGTMNLFIYWTNEKGGQILFVHIWLFFHPVIFLLFTQFKPVLVNFSSVDAEKELVTPPLDGIILPGVTRQSLLDLGRSWVRDRC